MFIFDWKQIWKKYISDGSCDKKYAYQHYSANKVARSIVFDFILSIAFEEASTYLSGLFYKIRY